MIIKVTQAIEGKSSPTLHLALSNEEMLSLLKGMGRISLLHRQPGLTVVVTGYVDLDVEEEEGQDPTPLPPRPSFQEKEAN